MQLEDWQVEGEKRGLKKEFALFIECFAEQIRAKGWSAETEVDIEEEVFKASIVFNKYFSLNFRFIPIIDGEILSINDMDVFVSVKDDSDVYPYGVMKETADLNCDMIYTNAETRMKFAGEVLNLWEEDIYFALRFMVNANSFDFYGVVGLPLSKEEAFIPDEKQYRELDRKYSAEGKKAAEEEKNKFVLSSDPNDIYGGKTQEEWDAIEYPEDEEIWDVDPSYCYADYYNDDIEYDFDLENFEEETDGVKIINDIRIDAVSLGGDVTVKVYPKLDMALMKVMYGSTKITAKMPLTVYGASYMMHNGTVPFNVFDSPNAMLNTVRDVVRDDLYAANSKYVNDEVGSKLNVLKKYAIAKGYPISDTTQGSTRYIKFPTVELQLTIMPSGFIRTSWKKEPIVQDNINQNPEALDKAILSIKEKLDFNITSFNRWTNHFNKFARAVIKETKKLTKSPAKNTEIIEPADPDKFIIHIGDTLKLELTVQPIFDYQPKKKPVFNEVRVFLDLIYNGYKLPLRRCLVTWDDDHKVTPSEVAQHIHDNVLVGSLIKSVLDEATMMETGVYPDGYEHRVIPERLDYRTHIENSKHLVTDKLGEDADFTIIKFPIIGVMYMIVGSWKEQLVSMYDMFNPDGYFIMEMNKCGKASDTVTEQGIDNFTVAVARRMTESMKSDAEDGNDNVPVNNRDAAYNDICSCLNNLYENLDKANIGYSIIKISAEEYMVVIPSLEYEITVDTGEDTISLFDRRNNTTAFHDDWLANTYTALFEYVYKRFPEGVYVIALDKSNQDTLETTLSQTLEKPSKSPSKATKEKGNTLGQVDT